MSGPGERGVALVRRPGRRLAEGIVTHLDRVPVDVDLARRQHEGYRAALRRCGWRVVEVAPTDRHPDAVFVEDTVVVVDDLAVLTRPGAPSRRGELAGTEAVVRALGLRPVRIEQPATLDGGDVLQAGRTVYVGLGGRTTRAGIDQLRGLLEPLGRTVVAVRLGEVLHLKSAVTALPDGSLVGLPHLVDTDVLPPVQAAEEEGGAHVVPLGGASILLAASAPRTAARLAAAGWLPEVVDIGEFEKLEGCVTCLSVLVPGDSLDRVGRT